MKYRAPKAAAPNLPDKKPAPLSIPKERWITDRDSPQIDGPKTGFGWIPTSTWVNSRIICGVTPKTLSIDS